MSPDPRAEVEHDLRSALHAAADSVSPSGRPLASGIARTAESRRRAILSRWVAPAAVAAAVAAVGIPSWVMASRQDTSGATPAASQPIVTEAGGYVTAAGVRFPLPAGWTARAVDQTNAAVTVCVAANPAPDCDGVTVRVAIPDADGGITPVPDALTFEDPVLASAQAAREPTFEVAPGTGVTGTVTASSAPATSEPPVGATTGSGSEYVGASAEGGVIHSSSAGVSHQTTEAMPVKPDLEDSLCPMLEDTNPVGGRPAQHMMIGSCAPGSPQAASWYVTDGSLSISTPRGVAAAQAAQIAAGVDFSGYTHIYGPQIAFMTSADSVPQTQTSEAPSSSPAGTARTSANTSSFAETSGPTTGPAGTAPGNSDAPAGP